MNVGFATTELQAKSALFLRALDVLSHRATANAHAFWVPGRIEFLGKHTDYAGGRSLLCAAERGFAVVSTRRVDARVHIVDACTGETADAELSADLAPQRHHWSNYPFSVCRRVARNFPSRLRGVDLAFASDLPPAEGLSSSSALIVSTFLALADANELAARPEYADAIRDNEDLAAYLGAVENGSSFRGLAGDRGVGTLGGSQDHTAILCARPGGLVQYGFAPVRHERDVPWPKGHVLVVAVSGVVAAKGAGAQASYNRASTTAAAALRVWREATGSSAPTLAAALAESPNALAKLKRLAEGRADLPVPLEALLARVQQLRDELDIVVAAGDALERGDLTRLGALVDMSQANAERLLGNQVPETVSLACSARELGAVAASAFGAGFGGSVYALVPESDAEQFRVRWTERYVTDFPAHRHDARFFITRAGPPATQLLSRGGAESPS